MASVDPSRRKLDYGKKMRGRLRGLENTRCFVHFNGRYLNDINLEL